MNSSFEAPYVPEEVSPWWLKGLAIFMALISIFMLLSVASGLLTPIFVDRLMPEDFEEVNPYPEDGTDEDKAEWNETNEFWDDMVEYTDEMMGVMKFQAVHSGILAIIGLFSVPVLWRGDRDLGIKLVGVWIGVNLLGGMGLMWMLTRSGLLMPEFATGRGGEEWGASAELMETITLVGSWGQIIFCNICFLGILGLVASKSKPPTMLVSGTDVPPQS